MVDRKFEIRSIRELAPKYKGEPRPTVAVAGRSNCGKSTLINALLGRKVAATSKAPGRTRKVHRFLINDRFDLVDLPGYGYAKVGEAMRRGWRRAVTEFLSGHGNLQRLLVLVDIRRGLGELDRELFQWAGLEQVPVAVALTKADKFGRMQQQKAAAAIRSELGPEVEIFIVSALKKRGMEELREAIARWWMRDAFARGDGDGPDRTAQQE